MKTNVMAHIQMWEEMRRDERNEVERYREMRVCELTTHASKDDEEWRKHMHIYSSLIGEVANPHTSTCIFALHLQRSGESAHFVMQQK